MHCNCSGPNILWKLQRLSGLQKLSLISKSGLSAYNDHVQNTSDSYGVGLFSEHAFPCYKNCATPLNMAKAAYHSPCQTLSLSASPRSAPSRINLSTFASQHSNDFSTHTIAAEHSVAATQASPAFQKTKNLFKEDMAYALEHAHSASPRLVAQPSGSSKQCSVASASEKSYQHVSSHQQPSIASSVSRTSSINSADSVADSVSSYHGYAGVNYHSGIKDIDAVPNSWGFSLNDYKSVLGEKYVHGCVPWEDQHVDKVNQKQFQKLHSKRVQLLQELHMVERDIRDLMD